MITAMHIVLLVFLLGLVSVACVLLVIDARQPIGQTRAEILSRLADEQAIADDLDDGRQ